MIEPTSNGAVTAAPRPKQLRIVYHPGERAVFTVISDAEFSLLNWCHRQAGQKMDRWVRAALLQAAKAQVTAANASHKPAPQGINEIVAGFKP